VRNFVFIGLWPLIGAGFMVWIFVESIPTLGGVVDAIGLGTLAAGLIPMGIYWAKGVPYFTRRPLDTSDVEESVPPGGDDAAVAVV
jgi:amino acid permease